MSTTIYLMARACYRARKRIVGLWLVIFAALAVLGLGGGGSFDNEFRVPGASSQEALDQLRMTFPATADTAALMVVVAPPGTRVDDPRVKGALEDSLADIATFDWVTGTDSPFGEYVTGMIADDGRAAYAQVRIAGGVYSFTDDAAAQLDAAGEDLEAELPGSVVRMGGEVYSEDLPEVSIVEGIGVIVAAIVLFLALGSVRAAAIPVMSGVCGAAMAALLILASTAIMPINSTTLILALMLALAVGIDYTLFIVSRHRAQLRDGMDVEESAAVATATAGSAVVFAGLTVIVALLGLSIAGIPFLTSMGAFAAAAVGLEIALALTFLPAMLGFLGERLRPRAGSRRARPPHRVARGWIRGVTRYPLLVVLIVVGLLGALTLPAKDLELALPNAGRSVPGAPDRVTYDLITEYYGPGANGPLIVTAPVLETDDPMAIIDELEADIEAMPGVRSIVLATPNKNADTAVIQLVPTTGPDDPGTADLVHRLRDRAPEWKRDLGVDTAVTGFTAVSIDVSERLAAALLPFGLFVVGLSLVLLTLVFRSIWVPVKAVLGYLLSVGAAFGATTLVFNQGHGKEIINLAEPLPVISFLPILLMGILFGLAMDYEVFLTSRMREEYSRGNSEHWLEDGFSATSGVVVAAAVIMFAVFASFVPVGSGMIKPIAFSLAVGVAVDAFVVRMVLGPAVMTLLGRRAWWLPSWLDRVLPSLDIEGEALAHQLATRDWPASEAPGAVHVQGLKLRRGRTTLLDVAELHAPWGATVLLTGPELRRTALLLALSGRLRADAGRVRVLGLVLPAETRTLRARSTFVDGGSPDTWAALEDSLGEIVFVLDADALHGPARDRLEAVMAGGDRTVVLSGDHESADLLAPARTPLTVNLTEARPEDADRPRSLAATPT